VSCVFLFRLTEDDRSLGDRTSKILFKNQFANVCFWLKADIGFKAFATGKRSEELRIPHSTAYQLVDGRFIFSSLRPNMSVYTMLRRGQ